MMKLEHVAVWTNNLETLKNYYEKYFGAVSNEKYTNPVTSFESYFLTFNGGSRIEIMRKPNVPPNANDITKQYLGIIHLAFEVDSRQEVDAKLLELKDAEFEILSGPRVTGDGYYEFETIDPDGNRVEVITKA